MLGALSLFVANACAQDVIPLPHGSPNGGAAVRRTTPVNHPPVLNTPPPQTVEDRPVTFQFTAFDPDPEDVVTILVVEAPVSGSLYQVASNGAPLLDRPMSDGEFVTNPQRLAHYVPNANFYGADSVRARPFDLAGPGSFALPVPIHVSGVNDPPISQNGVMEWPNSAGATIRNIQLVAADVDTQYASLQICITSLPAVGELRTRPAGLPITQVPFNTTAKSFEYQYENLTDLGRGCTPPDPNLPSTFPFEPGSFTYRVYDGEAYSAEAAIQLRFNYDNTAPHLTMPTDFFTAEDAPVDFTLSGADIDGDLFYFFIPGPPQHGELLRDGQPFSYPALLANNSSLSYVPDANFNTLNAALDLVAVQITDGVVRDCDYALAFEVTAVNDAPSMSAPTSIVTDGFSGGFNNLAFADDAASGSLLTVDLRAIGPAAGGVQFYNPVGLNNLEQLSATHVRIEGTLSAINATCANGVIFYVAQNGSTVATLEVEVNDQGNTGAGTPNPLTTLRAIPVDIPTEGGIDP